MDWGVNGVSFIDLSLRLQVEFIKQTQTLKMTRVYYFCERTSLCLNGLRMINKRSKQIKQAKWDTPLWEWSINRIPNPIPIPATYYRKQVSKQCYRCSLEGVGKKRILSQLHKTPAAIVTQEGGWFFRTRRSLEVPQEAFWHIGWPTYRVQSPPASL